MDHAAVSGHQLETSTGIDNRKVLMWVFLASECLFFAESAGKFDLKPVDAGKEPAKKM